MTKERIPSEHELNRRMQRMFNLQEGDMYCDDFSIEKLPRSSYDMPILNDENSKPLGYYKNFGTKKEKFIRYIEKAPGILMDPKTKEIVWVNPKKKKAVNKILSFLEKSAKSEE